MRLVTKTLHHCRRRTGKKNKTLTFCSQSSFRSSRWGEMLSHSMFKRSILFTPCTLGRPPSITRFGSTVSSLTLGGGEKVRWSGRRSVKGQRGVGGWSLMFSAGSRMTVWRNSWATLTSCMREKMTTDWLKKLSAHYLFIFPSRFYLTAILMLL